MSKLLLSLMSFVTLVGCNVVPRIISDKTPDTVVMMKIKDQIASGDVVPTGWAWILWYVPVLIFVVGWAWKEFILKKPEPTPKRKLKKRS